MKDLVIDRTTGKENERKTEKKKRKKGDRNYWCLTW